MPLGDLDLTWRTVRKSDFNVPGVRLRLEKDLSYHAAYLGRFGVFAKGISVRNTAQSLAACTRCLARMRLACRVSL